MKGREAYRVVAEELDDPETGVEDLDALIVEQARAYAKRSKRKWPPRPRSTGWEVRVWSLLESPENPLESSQSSSEAEGCYLGQQPLSGAQRGPEEVASMRRHPSSGLRESGGHSE